MAFHATGFRTIGTMGVPATTIDPGNVRQMHSFITNDDKATIETANYFDPLLTPAKKVRKGDLMVVSFDVDGTEGVKVYALDIVSNHVVISGGLGGVTLTGAALTDNTGGTASDTIADVPGTYTEATLANQLASIIRAVNRNTADIAAIKAAL